MGKVEKWVVLGVLALIVGILVVSLTVDDPLKKERSVMAGAPADVSPSLPTAPQAEPVQPARSTPSLLLSSSVDSKASEVAPPAATPLQSGPPAGSILKTTEGLQDSYMPDMKFYTWKSGDTFPVLAQRFYGDIVRIATLRRVNEGRTDVQPGDRVLVPVYDLDGAPPASAPPVEPENKAPSLAASSVPVSSSTHSSVPAPASSVSSAPVSSTSVSANSGSRFHVVQDGESLWRIAKQELGSGVRWKEIYDANRDLLASPEALHTGQKLRVP